MDKLPANTDFSHEKHRTMQNLSDCRIGWSTGFKPLAPRFTCDFAGGNRIVEEALTLKQPFSRKQPARMHNHQKHVRIRILQASLG
jgi:hypothetical protein